MLINNHNSSGIECDLEQDDRATGVIMYMYIYMYSYNLLEANEKRWWQGISDK